MSLRIAFLLTLLVLPSLARKSILKEYSMKDFSTNSSVVELTGQDQDGLVLKVSSDEKPFSATLKVLIKNKDGVVISPQVLEFFARQYENNCSENRDILQLKSPYRTVTFCSSDSRDGAKDQSGFLFKGSEVTISYTRRANSTSSFDLTLTAFNYLRRCRWRQFRCANRICISAKMKCDERDNCGDKSDERWCFNNTDAGYIVLYVLLAIVALAVVVCIVCACISYCRRRNNDGPRQPNPVPNAQSYNQGQPFGVPYGAAQPQNQGQPFGVPYGAAQPQNLGQPFGVPYGAAQPQNQGQPFGVPYGAALPQNQGQPFGVPYGAAQPQNQGQPFGVPYGAVQPPSPNAAPPPPGFK